MASNILEKHFASMSIQKTPFHFVMKQYFERHGELCDWIINLWNYSKQMLDDEVIAVYAIANLELIKDHWNCEKNISVEVVIDHLLRNDPSLFNFEVFIQPKDVLVNKLIVYDVITKSSVKKSTSLDK